MTQTVEIPKLDPANEEHWVVGKPGWFHVEYSDGRRHKPHIRCNCGVVTGIGLHHVHSDGTVTASFYHKKGTVYPEDPDGCEWHVFLKLLDYNEGDYPPEK